ncbi:hypothetical protein E2320_002367, partial [Naja naja]
MVSRKSGSCSFLENIGRWYSLCYIMVMGIWDYRGLSSGLSQWTITVVKILAENYFVHYGLLQGVHLIKIDTLRTSFSNNCLIFWTFGRLESFLSPPNGTSSMRCLTTSFWI